MSTYEDEKVIILIAEDSPTQAEELKFLLEENGYRVAAAPNGREALASARKEAPTLIISDVVMPEMDGFEFCREIKADKALQTIPVLLLTSLASPNDVIQGLESGADFFLRKPYDERHLLSRIDYVLSNRTLQAGARARGELEIVFAGQRHSIRSERQQILDLLISTYEEAVRINEELIEANKELEVQNREIERSSRFKDEFLSTMSHELRTPLNAVLGFSELLADSVYGPLSDRQRKYVEKIHNAGLHLLRLINDVLDLSRIEAGYLNIVLASVALDALVNDVLSLLKPLADKKGITLSASCPVGLVVHADPTRLQQILTNLVGNAIKFTPDGGQVDVAVHRQEESIRTEVRDTGPGIPAAEQKLIFESFYRAGQLRDREGTGLGLAIAKKLVEAHRGEFGLESEAGKGSCFYFSLPVEIPSQPAATMSANPIQ